MNCPDPDDLNFDWFRHLSGVAPGTVYSKTRTTGLRFRRPFPGGGYPSRSGGAGHFLR